LRVGDDGGYEEGGLQQWWLWGGWVATMKMIERERDMFLLLSYVCSTIQYFLFSIYLYILKKILKNLPCIKIILFSHLFLWFFNLNAKLFDFPSSCDTHLIYPLGAVLDFLSCCGVRLTELTDHLQLTIDLHNDLVCQRYRSEDITVVSR
jgi:hypothetical protein